MAASHRGIIAVLCGLLLALPAMADTKSIQGLVLNSAGKPIVGAEVRADRADGSAKRVVTKTDAEGRYAFMALPSGSYSITVVGEGGAHSLPALRTVPSASDSGQPIRRFISALPYQVKPDYRAGSSANVRARYVWKPGETGSHIGGRWIKASEAGDPSTNPLEKLGDGDFNRSAALRVNSAR
ncbi:MAG TPA: carboxypeptidase-like regulatory domain-containing protein [Chthoniobacterales bacterium]|jgi:hypothetical protein